MSSDNELIDIVLSPIFEGDKNFIIIEDPLDIKTILYYKLSNEYNFDGNNCIYFHLTDSALYLVNGSHSDLDHMDEDLMKSVLERIYIAKYNYEGWCTSYGEEILNWDIASAIQHDIHRVMNDIKRTFLRYNILNASPPNTIRHEYNYDEKKYNSFDDFEPSPMFHHD